MKKKILSRILFYSNSHYKNCHDTLDGSVYKGTWKVDHRDGKGSLRSPFGALYLGGFHKGNIGGEGTFKHARLPKDRVPRQTTSCGNITAQKNWYLMLSFFDHFAFCSFILLFCSSILFYLFFVL